MSNNTPSNELLEELEGKCPHCRASTMRLACVPTTVMCLSGYLALLPTLLGYNQCHTPEEVENCSKADKSRHQDNR